MGALNRERIAMFNPSAVAAEYLDVLHKIIASFSKREAAMRPTTSTQDDSVPRWPGRRRYAP